MGSVSPGTPNTHLGERACPPQADVGWVATACPGGAGTLEGLGAEALRTCLGRRSGGGGSRVRGRVWKVTLDGDWGPEEAGLSCAGAREAEGLRGCRSASLPGPSPSQTCGPLDRTALASGGGGGSREGGCVSPRGAWAWSVLLERPRSCCRAPGPRGDWFARPAAWEPSGADSPAGTPRTAFESFGSKQWASPFAADLPPEAGTGQLPSFVGPEVVMQQKGRPRLPS